MTPEQKQRKKSCAIRQIGGDDGYQWCLLVYGKTAYSGMTRSEAAWRRNRYIETGEL